MKKIKIKSYPDDSFEKPFWERNQLVAGIDEAGRGPLAGPVVAAAVIFPINYSSNIGINDSKKLSEKERENLFNIIKVDAISYSIVSIDNFIIDEINILNATMKAMKETVENLNLQPEHLLIDGSFYNNKGFKYTTIIKGDNKSISIAAASILAKVTRDRWMVDVADKKYPEYEFARHKGYATQKHIELIKKYGVCQIHRRSFLNRIIDVSNLKENEIMKLF